LDGAVGEKFCGTNPCESGQKVDARFRFNNGMKFQMGFPEIDLI
jgi:hypothetical protein